MRLEKLLLLPVVVLSLFFNCKTVKPPKGYMLRLLAITTDSLDLFDSSRMRHIPVALYYPKANGEEISGQLVIFSHGYGANKGGDNRAYSYLTDYLAARGYFVASIQHELPNDDLLPLTGDARVVRRPNWERGVANIRFAITALKQLYPALDHAHLTLIGHSNGGDMSMLFAHLHAGEVYRVVSLDNRRMDLPRTAQPRIFSLRSSDQPADGGVLPTPEEQKLHGITVIRLPNTIHNDMDDSGTAAQHEEINRYIMQFLQQ